MSSFSSGFNLGLRILAEARGAEQISGVQRKIVALTRDVAQSQAKMGQWSSAIDLVRQRLERLEKLDARLKTLGSGVPISILEKLRSTLFSLEKQEEATAVASQRRAARMAMAEASILAIEGRRQAQIATLTKALAGLTAGSEAYLAVQRAIAQAQVGARGDLVGAALGKAGTTSDLQQRLKIIEDAMRFLQQGTKEYARLEAARFQTMKSMDKESEAAAKKRVDLLVQQGEHEAKIARIRGDARGQLTALTRLQSKLTVGSDEHRKVTMRIAEVQTQIASGPGGLDKIVGGVESAFKFSTRLLATTFLLMYAVRQISALVAAPPKAMAALAGHVLETTERFKQLQTTFVGITGSMAASRDLMNEIVVASRGLPISALEGIESVRMAAFIPSIARQLQQKEGRQASIDNILRVLTGLSIINPQQGTSGAAFALREALAGQFMSIRRRFDVSPDVIASAGGTNLAAMRRSPELTLKAIRAFVDAFIGEDVFRELEHTLTAQGKRFRGTFDLFLRDIGESGFYDKVVDEFTRLNMAFAKAQDSGALDEAAARISDALSSFFDTILDTASSILSALTGKTIDLRQSLEAGDIQSLASIAADAVDALGSLTRAILVIIAQLTEKGGYLANKLGVFGPTQLSDERAGLVARRNEIMGTNYVNRNQTDEQAYYARMRPARSAAGEVVDAWREVLSEREVEKINERIGAIDRIFGVVDKMMPTPRDRSPVDRSREVGAGLQQATINYQRTLNQLTDGLKSVSESSEDAVDILQTFAQIKAQVGQIPDVRKLADDAEAGLADLYAKADQFWRQGDLTAAQEIDKLIERTKVKIQAARGITSASAIAQFVQAAANRPEGMSIGPSEQVRLGQTVGASIAAGLKAVQMQSQFLRQDDIANFYFQNSRFRLGQSGLNPMNLRSGPGGGELVPTDLRTLNASIKLIEDADKAYAEAGQTEADTRRRRMTGLREEIDLFGQIAALYGDPNIQKSLGLPVEDAAAIVDVLTGKIGAAKRGLSDLTIEAEHDAKTIKDSFQAIVDEADKMIQSLSRESGRLEGELPERGIFDALGFTRGLSQKQRMRTELSDRIADLRADAAEAIRKFRVDLEKELPKDMDPDEKIAEMARRTAELDRISKEIDAQTARRIAVLQAASGFGLEAIDREITVRLRARERELAIERAGEGTPGTTLFQAKGTGYYTLPQGSFAETAAERLQLHYDFADRLEQLQTDLTEAESQATKDRIQAVIELEKEGYKQRLRMATDEAKAMLRVATTINQSIEQALTDDVLDVLFNRGRNLVSIMAQLGKDIVRAFTQELIRLTVIKGIVDPLLSGIFTSFRPAGPAVTPGQATVVQAQGGMWSGLQVLGAAQGIITRPNTLLRTVEDGQPEAIVPLKGGGAPVRFLNFPRMQEQVPINIYNLVDSASVVRAGAMRDPRAIVNPVVADYRGRGVTHKTFARRGRR